MWTYIYIYICCTHVSVCFVHVPVLLPPAGLPHSWPWGPCSQLDLGCGITITGLQVCVRVCVCVCVCVCMCACLNDLGTVKWFQLITHLSVFSLPLYVYLHGWVCKKLLKVCQVLQVCFGTGETHCTQNTWICSPKHPGLYCLRMLYFIATNICSF